MFTTEENQNYSIQKRLAIKRNFDILQTKKCIIQKI